MASVSTPSRRRSRRSRAVAAVAALLLVALVSTAASVAEPMRVVSSSMAPTLHDGDQVVVDKRAYRGTATPQRGDLVAFERAPQEVFIKRVAAIAGDSVALEDGVLTVNGRARREAYVDQRRVDGVFFGPVVVPRGTVFVLGDNRGNSVDSRSFGPISTRTLIGRVGVRLWPPSRWGAP